MCPIDPALPDELPPGTVGEPYTTEIDHGVPASTDEVSPVGMLPEGLQTQDAPGRIIIEGTPTTAGRSRAPSRARVTARDRAWTEAGRDRSAFFRIDPRARICDPERRGGST